MSEPVANNIRVKDIQYRLVLLKTSGLQTTLLVDKLNKPQIQMKPPVHKE